MTAKAPIASGSCDSWVPTLDAVPGSPFLSEAVVVSSSAQSQSEP